MASPGQTVQSLVRKLENSSTSTVKKALAALTKLTKRSKYVEAFRKEGGLRIIIALLRTPNSSIVDMSMSALANCSMFEESRKEIRRLDGIAPVVAVLKNLKSTSILNRASRALANLAEDELNAVVIEELAAIQELVLLLNETSDADCQQSVLRGLRLICTTPERKKIVFELGGLRTMMKLLKSEKTALQNCCVKTVSELTKNCTKDIAQQVQENDGIKMIVALARSDHPAVQHAAVISIVNLSVHPHVRVCIGSEGGIQVLYQQIKSNESGHVTIRALEGLCYCCREAVNRNRVYESGGLELLLQQLISSEHQILHRKIIAAFNCFYYNEQCLAFLLNGGIIPALLSHLRKVISMSCSTNYQSVDADCDSYDHAYFTSDFSSLTGSPRSCTSILLDTTPDISQNEAFLEEAESLAIQVRDATESSRLLTFKRKPTCRMKGLSTSPQSVRSIDSSPSVFSFSSMETYTETSSVMRTLSSISVTTRPTVLYSFPPGLICSSTPFRASGSSFTSASDSGLVSNEMSAIACSEMRTLEDLDVIVSVGERSSNDKMNGCQSVEDNSCAITKTGIEFPSSLMASSEAKKDISLSSDKPSCSEEPRKTGDRTISHAPKVPKSPLSTAGTFTENTTMKNRNISPVLTSKKDCSSTSQPNFHGPGHSAVVLLSRFSLMNDQTSILSLLTKPCIGILLDYVSYLPDPSPKCARLLNRLTLDPQCFEGLIGMYITCDVYRQLVCGYTESYYNSAIESESGLEGKPSSFHDSKDMSEGAEESGKVQTDTVHPNKIVNHDSHSRCSSVGDQILENLACQAQTPFGKGVLLHLLAKGSGEDCQGCVLSLPHLCRSKSLQHQLLVNRNGLKMLCHLLVEPPTEKVFAAAVHSLAVLSSRIHLKLPNRVEQQLPSVPEKKVDNCESTPIIIGKRKFDSVEPEKTGISTESPSSELENQRVSKRPKLDLDVVEDTPCSEDHCSCKYSTNHFGPFDVQFKVDSGDLVPAHKQVLSCTSDVFVAMLSSSYREGTQAVVHLKEVEMATLTCAIHYAYGCSFPTCPGHSKSNTLCDNVRTIFDSSEEPHSKFKFLIELLALADRYLMAGLKSCCEELIVLSEVLESNAVSVCVYGSHYHSAVLCDYGLRFLLLEITSLPCQYQCFKEILGSQEKSKLMDHLYWLLLQTIEGNG